MAAILPAAAFPPAFNYRSGGGVILDLPGRGYGGWGFARTALVYSSQRYAWGDELISPVAFEIAIKCKPLTREEQKSLLN